jgi:hypothetical protein
VFKCCETQALIIDGHHLGYHIPQTFKVIDQKKRKVNAAKEAKDAW